MMTHGGEQWDGYPLRNWLYYDELDSWTDNPRALEVIDRNTYWVLLYEKLGKLTEDLSWV